MDESARIPIECSVCADQVQVKPTRTGEPRLPQGWHRHPESDDPLCAKCWKAGYILRAVTFPIAGPVGIDWAELRQILARCWAQSTRLATWAVGQLRMADVVRAPDMAKLPPMPRVYLYPAARELFPDIDPTSLNQVLHSVEAKYRRRRYEVVWTQSAALPSHRYPYPYPVHNQSWSAERGEHGEPLVSVRLGGQRVTLRLRGGHQFRRQLRAFDQITAGTAIRGAFEIYRARASAGDHRPAVEDRAPGGGQRVSYRILAKLVAWLPRSQRVRDLDGTLLLRTDAESFWVAEVPGREPWRLHADHVRRWVPAHRRRLDRYADDTKFEKRWPKRTRRQMNEAREVAVALQRRRLDTWLHQSTAMLAGYAERCGVSRVEYDDAVRSYVPSFPWAMLTGRLREKLDERGIALVVSEGAARGPDASEGAGSASPTDESEGAG